MSCKVLSFRSPRISLKQPLKETERNLSFDAKALNYSEMEILLKINTILEDLKELEQNFSKLRQDILKKNTIEGRENSKICAVQGKVISKNYYKTLGEDIEFVSKMFQDQSKKIAKEISSISLISKTKGELINNHGSSGDNGSFSIAAEPSTPLLNPNLRLSEFAAIRQLKTFEIKSSSSQKEKFQLPFTLKAEPILEGAVPKILRPEILSSRRPLGPKAFTFDSPKTSTSAKKSENVSPNLDNLEPEGTRASPLGISSIEINHAK